MLPLYVAEICQKTGTSTENKKAIFFSPKKCHKPDRLYGGFYSTDWHLQRLNLNFMSGKDQISETTKPFAFFEDKNTWIHAVFNFPVPEKDIGTIWTACLSPFMTISLCENK